MALTSTDAMPSTWERKPGAVRSARTEIVSFANVFELNWIEETPPPVLRRVLLRQRLRILRKCRQLLRRRQSGCIGDGLGSAVGPEPGADVHDEGAGGAQRDDRDGEQGQHLAVFRP